MKGGSAIGLSATDAFAQLGRRCGDNGPIADWLLTKLEEQLIPAGVDLGMSTTRSCESRFRPVELCGLARRARYLAGAPLPVL